MLFLFENFALDTDRRELRRGPDLLSLEPQVFDLLVFLLENRDRVVSRDDVLQSVWGGRTVSESTLATRISAARRALDDTGEQQRLIRTVLRKGFRFIGAAQEVQTPVERRLTPCDRTPDAGRMTEPPRPSQRGRRASFAVMPFTAAPGCARSFADGVTHDIISGLARLRALFVVARGSTFALRDQMSHPGEIGRVLHVDYAAIGSVEDNGDRLHITAELCTTDDNRVIWADSYEIPRGDAFLITGKIATRIVSSLDAEIEATERNRAVLKPPNSLNAWEAHHRGLWHMYRFTEPDNEQAQRYFRRAIKLDPTFSRAYAGLSFTHWYNAFQFKSTAKQAEADSAFVSASRGLLADHRDPAAHWAMGRALWLRGEDEASIRELNEAIGLSPNFALAHYQLGFVQAQTGDAQAAVEAVEVARQLSPFDPMLYAMCAARAWALFRLKRFEEAGEWALNTIRQPNASLHARALSALVLARVGRLEESLREVDVVRRLRPGYTINDFFFAFHVLADDKPVYLAAAKQIGMG